MARVSEALTSRTMDERHEQFIIAVGDVCAAAQLGGLEVEICLRDGVTARGVPGSVRSASSDADEVDASGYSRTFRVARRLVALDEIVECTIHAPPLPGGAG